MVLDVILDAVLLPSAYVFPPYDRLTPRQIRTLSLQKNRHEPQISGNLRKINLADHVRTQDHPAGGEAREAPPYHAVSYTASDLKKVRFQCDSVFSAFFNVEVSRAFSRAAPSLPRAHSWHVYETHGYARP